MDMQHEIRKLQQEIERLKRRIEQRPVIPGMGAGAQYQTVSIDQGNVLETGQNGIKYYEGELAEVPSAYNPNVTTSFIDGVGRGTLYINGVSQPGYVLVLNDDRGSFRNALVSSDVIYAGGPVSIPVNGGGSVQVYLAG